MPLDKEKILEQIHELEKKAELPSISETIVNYNLKYSNDEDLKLIYGKEYFDGTHYGSYRNFGGYTDKGFFAKMAKIINLVFKPKKVLDVGCAKGFLVNKLRMLGIDAYGTDISQYALDSAPPEVMPYLKIANISEQDFPDNSFDLVLCLEVMEHLFPNNLLPAIEELYRLTNKYAFLSIASQLNTFDKTHISLFSSETWEKIFTKTGFNVNQKLTCVFRETGYFKIQDSSVFVFEKS